MGRIEILDEIIDIATRAVDRLSDKLEAFRGKGVPVEMSEEFRHTTLQVIGEAILSLSPEECDRVRASLTRSALSVCSIVEERAIVSIPAVERRYRTCGALPCHPTYELGGNKAVEFLSRGFPAERVGIALASTRRTHSSLPLLNTLSATFLCVGGAPAARASKPFPGFAPSSTLTDLGWYFAGVPDAVPARDGGEQPARAGAVAHVAAHARVDPLPAQRGGAQQVHHRRAQGAVRRGSLTPAPPHRTRTPTPHHRARHPSAAARVTSAPPVAALATVRPSEGGRLASHSCEAGPSQGHPHFARYHATTHPPPQPDPVSHCPLSSPHGRRWAARQRGEVAKEGSGDIVERAMAAIPAAEWGPAAWTQLCYEIKTFLLAGHETSAAMLTFALFELTQHPHVLAQGE